MTEALGIKFPERWRVSRLKHVTEILNRGTAPTYVDRGPVRVVSQATNQASGLDWSRSRFHEFSGDPETLKGYLRYGDVLVNSTGTGTLGRVGYFMDDPEGFPCMVDSHVTQVRTSDTLHSRFAYYWLSSRPVQEFIYAALVVGATNQIELNRDRLGDSPIPLPSLEEQRLIACFLDTETARIDEILGRTSRQVELLKLRRRAFIDARLGEISSGRDLIPIRHVLRPSFEDQRPDLPILSVYRDYGVIPKESRQDNFNKTPEDVSRYLVVRPRDVVVNKMKAWQGSLGVSSYEGIVSPDYLVAHITDDAIYSRYLHYLLRSPRMVAEYAVRSRGIRPAQWRLYWEDLAQISIPIPDSQRQSELVRELERDDQWVETALLSMEKRATLVAERRQALITAAVTGQFDVSSASGRGVEE
ncbi:restriction endonuclease subunit S [Nonomuraea spiralis]|uniref:restriction endonuclease subunit S n=1 Tax=Nonomuraea spiralis TaxID=46182 RepID=UPI0037AA4476